jgi:3-oxoacyl-[acyl-carrier-protein] synthase II
MPLLQLIGASAVTSIGSDWPESWKALLSGKSNFSPIHDFFPSWPEGPAVGGLKKWPDAIPPPETRTREILRISCKQLAATVDDIFDKHPSAKIGLVVATSHGESGAISKMVRHSILRYPPTLTNEDSLSVIGEQLIPAAWDGLGRKLSSTVIAAACASAIVALNEASNKIRLGVLDACIVVAADSLSIVAYTGFKRIGALSSTVCKPFDVTRDGTTMAEAGVGTIVCNDKLDLSQYSGAAILGCGLSCDARHAVEPSEEGVLAAAQSAIYQAGLAPSDIKAVYWHGSGTVQSDTAEARVAQVLFGPNAPYSTATKGTIGHAMGASAGINILAATETVKSGNIPPTVNVNHVAFDSLNLITDMSKQITSGPVLIVALGFGGINAAAVIGSVSS